MGLRRRQRASGWRLFAALGGLALLGSLAVGFPAPPQAGKGASRFEADVLPILRAKCLRCHGEKVRKAGLDLRTAAGALKGGDGGPAVVPGSPEKSLLHEKVHGGEMPPGKEGPLGKDE